jgi:hypothetical protein
MKTKFILAILLLISIFTVNAQTYSIQLSTGTSTDYNYQATNNTILSSGNQVLSAVQSIPFDFNFYGQTITEYKVSDNGYITFDVSATVSNEVNTTLPSANAPTDAIFAFWDDLDLASGSSVTDEVVSFTYGTSPNRVHVIQWHSVTPISGTGYLYAAIRLYETSCGTEFDVIQLYGNASGMSATIGCQNATGTDGTQSSLSPNEDYSSTSSTNSDDIVYSFSSSIYDYDLSVVVETNLDEVMTVSGTTNLDIAVQNTGAQLVTSFDLNYSINGGITQTDNISTGLNSGSSNTYLHSVVFNPLTAGQYYNFEIWTDNINGNNDELNCNDTLSKSVWVNLGISGTKKVLLEEFTTEPCGYCPDGTLTVVDITNQNPFVIAVGHHAGYNTDFLTTTFHSDYADDMTSGAPKAAIDRYDFEKDGSKVAISRSNSGWSDAVVELYNYPTPVNISIDALVYNSANNSVDAVVNLDFVDYPQPGNISLTLWVVEDSIDPQNQINYYSSQSSSGGAGGSSHPYYNLPYNITTAEANLYQHRHTTKQIETASWGDAIGNTNPAPGDTYQRTFNNISLNGMSYGQVYLVAAVSYDDIDITKRLVLNSAEEHVEGMVSSVNNLELSQQINIFPNPMSQIGYIAFSVEKNDYVNINIYNILGENVMPQKDKQYVAGNHIIAINSLNLSAGTYFVEIKTTEGISKQKFTIIH